LDVLVGSDLLSLARGNPGPPGLSGPGFISGSVVRPRCCHDMICIFFLKGGHGSGAASVSETGRDMRAGDGVRALVRPGTDSRPSRLPSAEEQWSVGAEELFSALICFYL
jgi:hypothetical protein